MPSLPTPGLDYFALNEEEMLLALRLPVKAMVRAEMKILPENNPKKIHMIKRIVATGLQVWSERGQGSISALITKLLYLYFTGQLVVVAAGQHIQMVSTPSIPDDEYDTEFEDDFDDNFGFKEG